MGDHVGIPGVLVFAMVFATSWVFEFVFLGARVDSWAFEVERCLLIVAIRFDGGLCQQHTHQSTRGATPRN